MSKYKHQQVIREKILERIDFLSDHWVKGDDRPPFNFGGWREEVADNIMEIIEQFLDEQLEKKEEEVSEEYERKLLDAEKEKQKIIENFMEEIRRLRGSFPYRGVPYVTIEKDGISYRVMITDAFDTPEGIVIRGKI